MLNEHLDIREEVRDAVHGPIEIVIIDLVIYELVWIA